MPVLLQSDHARTTERIAAVSRYFDANVTSSRELICSTAEPCKKSHDGDFYESQHHHVGRNYDMTRGGKPLRIVVVGQEYGHGPAFVSIEDRRRIIVDRSGRECRFKAIDGLPARNPHMKGCTSLLRLIFGLGLGTDHDGEFVTIDGGRIHVFECFALVNFLLCSAVPANDGAKKRKLRLGGSPGRSSKTMQTNCSRHFRTALEILEPTLVIAQGLAHDGVRSWIAGAYGLPKRRPQDGIEPIQIGAATATLVTFSHPSAHGALNWGMNERMPYLLNTVAPTIGRVMDDNDT